MEVDGTRMHFVCEGEGEPWLMMENGLMADVVAWDLVWEDLSKITRVCAYDRPGLGWSDNIDEPRDGTSVAAALNHLLEKAAPDGQFILLGMSAGGVYVRDYYQQFPERVVGMVLIDSSHEQQTPRLEEIYGADGNPLTTPISICATLSPFGVMRAFGVWEKLLDSFTPGLLNDENRGEILSLQNYTHHCSALSRELAEFALDTSREQGPVSLGSLPLLVLSQGELVIEENLPPGTSLESAVEARAIWDDLQISLAQLSTKSRRVVATESGHMIQLNQPDLVIAEFQTFMQELGD